MKFAEKYRVGMVASYTDTNRNMPDWTDANHWKVTLKHDGRQYTTYYSMGYGIHGEPSVDDVLDCLASDASGFEGVCDFDDWARGYGYDTDNRKAERTFNLIEKQALKLQKLLGTDLYSKLLWDTERL